MGAKSGSGSAATVAPSRNNRVRTLFVVRACATRANVSRHLCEVPLFHPSPFPRLSILTALRPCRTQTRKIVADQLWLSRRHCSPSFQPSFHPRSRSSTVLCQVLDVFIFNGTGVITTAATKTTAGTSCTLSGGRQYRKKIASQRQQGSLCVLAFAPIL